MNTLRASRRLQQGFTLLEVLVSLVILVFGLLGLIGMQAYTQVATFESLAEALQSLMESEN